jgi:hypothetical protein
MSHKSSPSLHKEGIMLGFIFGVILHDNKGNSKATNEQEQQGIVEVLLEQVKVVLWGHSDKEYIKTIG